MGDKQLRIAASEFQFLGLTCANCQSEIRFNAAAARGPGELWCPNCGARMERGEDLVAFYRRFLQAVGETTTRAHLIVTLKDEVPHLGK